MSIELTAYDVMLPLPDGVNKYTLCSCDTIQSVNAILTALLHCEISYPTEITILVHKITREH